MSNNPPSYNPEAFGARCSTCYLSQARDGAPVPAETHAGAKAIVIAEAPGSDEVDAMRPLVGRSGVEATQGFLSIGMRRDDLDWTNACLCRPPKNDFSALIYRMQKENKTREKAGLPAWENPIDACRPRLMREVAKHTNVFTLGKTGLTAITQQARSVMDLRGAPIDGWVEDGGFRSWEKRDGLGQIVGRPLRVMPTIHPAFVLRMRRWAKIFRSDLARGARWFNGKLEWREPEVIFDPDPKTLRDFLFGGASFYAYDVETDAKESLVAKLRCVGIATTEKAVVVGLLSVMGFRMHSSAEEQELCDILREFFTDPRILKVGHNAGYYDRIVIEQQLGVTPAPLTDTILLHRGAESELPHNLGFVGSVYTDVTKAWKASHAATEAQSDNELWDYNATDCVVTARIAPPLVQAVDLRGQRECVRIDHKIQGFCVGLHRTGLFIDRKARDAWDTKLTAEAAEFRMAAKHTAGDPDHNPGSVEQVKKLLYRDWGLEAENYTAMGEPSTDDESIRAMLVRPYLQPVQRGYLQALRKFRRAAKLKGTYIARMRPVTDDVWLDDLSIDADTPEGAAALGEEDNAEVAPDPEGFFTSYSSKKRGKKTVSKKTGLILPDGRCHPQWNSHVAVTGRLSSSEPNAQNWPYKIRNMVVPEPGHILVGADMDQIELRMCSALAGAARYLEVFKKGGDPHALTSEFLYGKAFTQADDATRKRLRDFAKRFTYAVLYGASVETVWETITSAENDKGELLFPNVKLSETRLLYDKWLGANPEFYKWWDDVVEEWRRQGYLAEPYLNRRRDFADGEDRNEIINFKAQACAGSIVNMATVDLIDGPIPFDRWGPGTGFIAQIHDALYVECPIDQEKNVKGWLKEAMTRTVPGFDVVFGAKPKSGMRWDACA